MGRSGGDRVIHAYDQVSYNSHCEWGGGGGGGGRGERHLTGKKKYNENRSTAPPYMPVKHDAGLKITRC